MITAIRDRLDVPVEELKAFLKIDHAEEDLLLADLIESAKLQADHFCQNEFIEIDEETGAETLLVIPTDIKIAVLRIAAALYENRADHIAGESVQGISYQTGQIEWNAQRILQPYRKFFAV